MPATTEPSTPKAPVTTISLPLRSAIAVSLHALAGRHSRPGWRAQSFPRPDDAAADDRRRHPLRARIAQRIGQRRIEEAEIGQDAGADAALRCARRGRIAEI